MLFVNPASFIMDGLIREALAPESHRAYLSLFFSFILANDNNALPPFLTLNTLAEGNATCMLLMSRVDISFPSQGQQVRD